MLLISRVVLISRLAVRDLRRRPVEAALLLVAILAATTTLTLGLVLRDSATDPYQQTRAITSGPDVIAVATGPDRFAHLTELSGKPEVTGSSGPFPVVGAKLLADGRSSDVQVIGRDTAVTAVDQPKLLEGTWVRTGAVVVEGAFASAFNLHSGDPVTVGGRALEIAGVAVSAASAPYPGASCMVPQGCRSGPAPRGVELPEDLLETPGTLWMTRADAESLPGTTASLMNLTLSDPAQAENFVNANLPDLGFIKPNPEQAGTGRSPAADIEQSGTSGSPAADIEQSGTSGSPAADIEQSGTGESPAADIDGMQAAVAEPPAPDLWLRPWTEVRADATEVAGDSQILLMIGAWLLGLLALASLSVLVGGRMADQTKRVGLLKAVGGTPGLVAAVLLAEYLFVALLAAAAGLALGTVTAPFLTAPGAGLIGSAGTPSITPAIVLLVTGTALGVALLATAIPSVRAARSSTVRALADAARPPRRTGWLITLSAHLPVPLLLALRIAARRPRRTLLAIAGITVTVSGIYVAMILTNFISDPANTGLSQPQTDSLVRVLLLWTSILLILAGVNAVVITWATVLDNRHPSALTRALGATPNEVTSALVTVQLVPALIGTVVGFPVGYALYRTIVAITGGDSSRATQPAAWQMAAILLTTLSVVALLTAIPSRLGGNRPPAQSLNAELT